MSELTILTDRAALERYLRRDTALNIYLIGDLDDFFWPHTTWYGLLNNSQIAALALLYRPSGLPTLIVLINGEFEPARALLKKLTPHLPDKVYAHLTPGIEDALAREFRLDSHGDHLKMILRSPDRLEAVKSRESVPLTIEDKEEIEAFYAASYPGNWFDARMLETGHYWGIRLDGKMVAAGGVHVCSERYRVAALGNIATDPAYRGRGLATDVTASICRKLLGSVDAIGLNVKADNSAAIACYTRLGFEVTATYREILLVRQAN